jgi:hypothetical protein
MPVKPSELMRAAGSVAESADSGESSDESDESDAPLGRAGQPQAVPIGAAAANGSSNAQGTGEAGKYTPSIMTSRKKKPAAEPVDLHFDSAPASLMQPSLRPNSAISAFLSSVANSDVVPVYEDHSSSNNQFDGGPAASRPHTTGSSSSEPREPATPKGAGIKKRPPALDIAQSFNFSADSTPKPAAPSTPVPPSPRPAVGAATPRNGVFFPSQPAAQTPLVAPPNSSAGPEAAPVSNSETPKPRASVRQQPGKASSSRANKSMISSKPAAREEHTGGDAAEVSAALQKTISDLKSQVSGLEESSRRKEKNWELEEKFYTSQVVALKNANEKLSEEVAVLEERLKNSLKDITLERDELLRTVSFLSEQVASSAYHLDFQYSTPFPEGVPPTLVSPGMSVGSDGAEAPQSSSAAAVALMEKGLTSPRRMSDESVPSAAAVDGGEYRVDAANNHHSAVTAVTPARRYVFKQARQKQVQLRSMDTQTPVNESSDVSTNTRIIRYENADVQTSVQSFSNSSTQTNAMLRVPSGAAILECEEEFLSFTFDSLLQLCETMKRLQAPNVEDRILQFIGSCYSFRNALAREVAEQRAWNTKNSRTFIRCWDLLLMYAYSTIQAELRSDLQRPSPPSSSSRSHPGSSDQSLSQVSGDILSSPFFVPRGSTPGRAEPQASQGPSAGPSASTSRNSNSSNSSRAESPGRPVSGSHISRQTADGGRPRDEGEEDIDGPWGEQELGSISAGAPKGFISRIIAGSSSGRPSVTAPPFRLRGSSPLAVGGGAQTTTPAAASEHMPHNSHYHSRGAHPHHHPLEAAGEERQEELSPIGRQLRFADISHIYDFAGCIKYLPTSSPPRVAIDDDTETGSSVAEQQERTKGYTPPSLEAGGRLALPLGAGFRPASSSSSGGGVRSADASNRGRLSSIKSPASGHGPLPLVNVFPSRPSSSSVAAGDDAMDGLLHVGQHRPDLMHDPSSSHKSSHRLSATVPATSNSALGDDYSQSGSAESVRGPRSSRNITVPKVAPLLSVPPTSSTPRDASPHHRESNREIATKDVRLSPPPPSSALKSNAEFKSPRTLKIADNAKPAQEKLDEDSLSIAGMTDAAAPEKRVKFNIGSDAVTGESVYNQLLNDFEEHMRALEENESNRRAGSSTAPANMYRTSRPFAPFSPLANKASRGGSAVESNHGLRLMPK